MQRHIQPVSEPINSRISVPGSKKITHRAIMLAALADGVSELTHVNFNDSTHSLIHALQQTGIVIQVDEAAATCIVAGCNGKLPKKHATIWCGDVEMTARFLLTACAASAGMYYLNGEANLRHVEIQQQTQLLCRRGAQSIPSDNYQLPLTLLGADNLEGDEIIFDKTTPSGVITSCLLLSPYARSAFTLKTPFNNKQHHIDMTCSMMAEFGVLARKIHRNQIMIPVPQRFSARDYFIEPDLNLLVFFIAAAMVTAGHIQIQAFKRSRSKQIDIKSLSLFEKMGCLIQESPDEFSIQGPEVIVAQEFKLRKFNASFAAIISIAPFAKAPTTIFFTNKLYKQKLEWLTHLSEELNKLKLKVEVKENAITIFPGAPCGTTLNCHGDQHLAMIFAVIGLRAPGTSIINTEALDKNFPQFFQCWDQLTETNTSILPV